MRVRRGAARGRRLGTRHRLELPDRTAHLTDEKRRVEPLQQRPRRERQHRERSDQLTRRGRVRDAGDAVHDQVDEYDAREDTQGPRQARRSCHQRPTPLQLDLALEHRPERRQRDGRDVDEPHRRSRIALEQRPAVTDDLPEACGRLIRRQRGGNLEFPTRVDEGLNTFAGGKLHAIHFVQ